MSTFGNYPLRFLPGIVSGAIGVPEAVAIVAPAIGLAAYVGSRGLWQLALRRYPGVNG